MSTAQPNRVHHISGESTFGAAFGELLSVNPIQFPGRGHVPHIEARFKGLRLDMTPTDLVAFIRQGQEDLAKIPAVWYEHLHDSVGGAE